MWDQLFYFPSENVHEHVYNSGQGGIGKREEKVTKNNYKSGIISFTDLFFFAFDSLIFAGTEACGAIGYTLTFMASTVNSTLLFHLTSCCCFNILNNCQIQEYFFKTRVYKRVFSFLLYISKILKIEIYKTHRYLFLNTCAI